MPSYFCHRWAEGRTNSETNYNGKSGQIFKIESTFAKFHEEYIQKAKESETDSFFLHFFSKRPV